MMITLHFHHILFNANFAIKIIFIRKLNYKTFKLLIKKRKKKLKNKFFYSVKYY